MSSDTDSAKLLAALKFAADKHRDQRRKDADASPYINHPIGVAEVLARAGVVDIVALQAAILHDTIEDTNTTPEEIDRHFGRGVLEVVLEMTDDKSLPKDARKRLQIDHAARISTRAKLVKLGDKICNVIDVTYSPPINWSHQRRQDYLDWTEQVVAGCRGCHDQLEQLYDDLLAEGRKVLLEQRALT